MSSMRITTQHLLAGAAKAKGICVLIDVFRSSNTMLAILSGGVKEIIQVRDVKEALALKKTHSGWLLFGERSGVAPPGFNFGNSPVEAERAVLKGRTAILCTSAGSAGIWALTGAEKILIASFANAGAVIEHLKTVNEMDMGQGRGGAIIRDTQVTLVAIGKEGAERAAEDDLCAEYIRAHSMGNGPDYEGLRSEILASPTAQRLRDRGQEDDLESCLRLDIYAFIPRVYKEKRLLIVRKN